MLARLGWLIVTAGVLGGCATLLAVGKQHERADLIGIISGTVTTDYDARGPLVVGLSARRASGELFLVDHFVAEKPGPWIFGVEPGTYWLGAFEDADRDGHYDDEPALRPDPERPVTLGPGEQLHGIALRIPREGRLPRGRTSLGDVEARERDEQQRVSAFALSVAGQVTTLDDPRFDREVARKGMWQYYDFLLEGRPGIYFLEPYDATRIPVLFVHGIGGTPQEFRFLIEQLDRSRFQPWVFYYASGARLEVVATVLTQLFVRLRQEYGFTRAAVVAHSMGGLVTRDFLLQDYERNGTQVVRTYVTISSPLGGMASAAEGVVKSPVVLRSWFGLAPDGAYLNGLFFTDGTRTARRRLPSHIAYHLLFGFHGGGPDGSGDGVVTVASQLRPEAQEEARSQRGFDEDHTSILRSPAVAAQLNDVLSELR